jgi:hypothetical protein
MSEERSLSEVGSDQKLSSSEPTTNIYHFIPPLKMWLEIHSRNNNRYRYLKTTTTATTYVPITLELPVPVYCIFKFFNSQLSMWQFFSCSFVNWCKNVESASVRLLACTGVRITWRSNWDAVPKIYIVPVWCWLRSALSPNLTAVKGDLWHRLNIQKDLFLLLFVHPKNFVVVPVHPGPAF